MAVARAVVGWWRRQQRLDQLDGLKLLVLPDLAQGAGQPVILAFS
jgi:hypothetical protein